MAEIAAAGVGFRVPVVGQFDERRGVGLARLDVLGRGEENQREAALLVDDAARLDHAHFAGEEID